MSYIIHTISLSQYYLSDYNKKILTGVSLLPHCFVRIGFEFLENGMATAVVTEKPKCPCQLKINELNCCERKKGWPYGSLF
jgi:hypothetical protein